MTPDVIRTAVREGLPFSIQMADGREYVVRDQWSIAVAPTRVIVLDEQALPHVLPLTTMTGVSYFRWKARPNAPEALPCTNVSLRVKQRKPAHA